ncbi:glycosyltransferase family 39 protein [Streptacidiphilus cavernicola]|uniref:Glycosyltransferase family 39 protein n=1 Tax=Streptacidiphilus cavernicola TaxID=3342716 RepID=A0ABV6W3U7_9ACTN
MVLALLLGFWGIGRGGSFWGDEAVSLQVAHRDTGRIMRLTQHVDAVHGCYYLLLHGLFRLHDGGAVLLRTPSVLATAAAAGGIALVGRRLASPRAGLAAGLAFPAFPAVQYYAQEGRSYALVCAVVVGSWLLLLRAVERPTVGRWACYGLAALATGLLHEYAVLAVAAQGLTLLTGRQPRRVRAGWALATGAAAVAMLPLVLRGAEQAGQVAWIAEPGTGTVLFGAGLALVGVLCALVRVPPRPDQRISDQRIPPPSLRALALPVLLLPQGALLLVSFCWTPVYLDRYVLFEYAGLALLVGAALDAAGRALPRLGWRALLAVPAALLLLLPLELHLRTPQSRGNDLAGAAHAVRALARPGDGVLFLPSSLRQSALALPRDYTGLRDLALLQDGPSLGNLSGTEVPSAAVPGRLRGADRIVTVRVAPGSTADPASGQDLAKKRVLAAGFQVCAQRSVRGLLVTAYARPGHC